MNFGALPDPKDERDFQAEPLMASAPPVDWSKPISLPQPPLWNQEQSDACVGASWSYYHWQLRDEVFSKRDLFARIAQSYGAYIRDGGVTIVKIGQETEKELPDPITPDPANMRDKTGLNDKQAADDRELDSFVLPNTIDSCAQAVRDYKGCVFGVTGTNEGWKDLANPRPPQTGETTWGHALYLYGFHLHDNEKCVIARSSWDGTDHHIRENYFTSGNTFNPWTLIPRTMSQFKTQNYKGELRIVLQASTPEQWAALCAVYGIDPTKPADENV